MGRSRRFQRQRDNASSRVDDIRQQIRKDIEPDVKIDGSRLEGGGQLLRVALCLSALTSRSIHITRIRANRSGQQGLKYQHLACVQTLARLCQADTIGAELGSQDLLFVPGQGEVDRYNEMIEVTLKNGERVLARSVLVEPATPGAVTLILQAVLPYILFQKHAKPTVLSLRGATHTTSSPSVDYINSVLLSNLRTFGLPEDCIQVLNTSSHILRRTLTSFGEASYLIWPLTHSNLRFGPPSEAQDSSSGLPTAIASAKTEPSLYAYVLFGSIQNRIDYSSALVHHLGTAIRENGIFERYSNVYFHLAAVGSSSVEKLVMRRQLHSAPPAPGFDSAKPGGRTIHIQLVAVESDGVAVGADHRHTFTHKPRGDEDVCRLEEVTKGGAGLAVDALQKEMHAQQHFGTCMDSHMRDQIVVFLGLLGGRVAKPKADHASIRTKEDEGGRGHEQHGLSLHAQTAIWITELMLGVEFDPDGQGVAQGWLARDHSGHAKESTNEEVEERRQLTTGVDALCIN